MQPFVLCFAYSLIFALKAAQSLDQLEIDGSRGLKRAIHVQGSENRVSYGNFAIDKFRRLEISSGSSIIVRNYRECAGSCLNNPPCSSFNVGSSPRSDGTFRCELLNGDKYSTGQGQLVISQEFHHYSIKTPCTSFPCQNNATCVPNYSENLYHCDCVPGYKGKHCETALRSCQDAYDVNTSSISLSQLATIIVGGQPASVYCHMGNFGCGNGGWTTAMKIDGNKKTFHYDAEYWTDKNHYNLPGGETGFDSQQTKLPTYWNTPFSKICLGMKMGDQLNFVVINKQANSLHSLISDGQYRSTTLGRNTWKTLLGSQASLQFHCNKEGFNAVSCSSQNCARVRIGLMANDQNDCTSCNSGLGFGGAGYPDDSNTCGNAARHTTDNGDKFIKTMGYILVQ